MHTPATNRAGVSTEESPEATTENNDTTQEVGMGATTCETFDRRSMEVSCKQHMLSNNVLRSVSTTLKAFTSLVSENVRMKKIYLIPTDTCC